MLRYQFCVGWLIWPAFEGAVNYGRSLGLAVDLHCTGWLTRRGWLVANGAPDDLARLESVLDRTVAAYA